MLGLGVALGCATRPVPNPNSTIIPDQVTAGHAMSLLRAANETLQARRKAGTLDRFSVDELNVLYAKDVAAALPISTMVANNAWVFGEVYRSAKEWKLAQRAFEYSVTNATDRSRFVLDRLRLAEAESNLGNISRAIQLVRESFNSTAQEKPPILIAVLYEIVPPAVNKGRNTELAELLDEAILQHEQAVVDPNSPAGKKFLEVRPFHINRARRVAMALRWQG